jgi:hypothetical protein
MQWMPQCATQLTTARANVAAVVTEDKCIYVIGGFNGKVFLNTIEVLVPGTLLLINY